MYFFASMNSNTIHRLNHFLKEQDKCDKPELGIEFVAMKSNYHKLPKLIDLAKELNALEMDCWGNSPSCAECLWSRKLIACP